MMNEDTGKILLFFMLLMALYGTLKSCEAHTQKKEEQPVPPKAVIEQSHVKPSYLKNLKLASNNRQHV